MRSALSFINARDLRKDRSLPAALGATERAILVLDRIPKRVLGKVGARQPPWRDHRSRIFAAVGTMLETTTNTRTGRRAISLFCCVPLRNTHWPSVMTTAFLNPATGSPIFLTR